MSMSTEAGGDNRGPSAAELSIAHRIIQQLPAMAAYWGRDQCCVFANEAYQQWLGISPAAMRGLHAKKFFGPLYAHVQPHIEAALNGTRQQFEFEGPVPHSTDTRIYRLEYEPVLSDGVVQGLVVLATDITEFKRMEQDQQRLIGELERALSEVQALTGLLPPICAWCKRARTDDGYRKHIETYVRERTDVRFSHGICPECEQRALERLDEFVSTDTHDSQDSRDGLDNDGREGRDGLDSRVGRDTKATKPRP
jgi:PAS domain S-box-containing protein